MSTISTQSDSTLPGLPAAMPTGTEGACGFAAAAIVVRASRCGGSHPAHSGSSGGEESHSPIPGYGKGQGVKRGEKNADGSASEGDSGEAVTMGDEQERATSCRKVEAAKGNDTQRTKRERERVPDGRGTAPATNASSPVDSPHPKDRANTPHRNEETEPGLSRHRRYATMAGEGDPPQGRGKAGEPTKETPRCNDGDSLNSAVISDVDTAQQPTKTPTKQQEHTANWLAVDWVWVKTRIFRTQRAIYNASKQGNIERVFCLQLELMTSHYAKLLAVQTTTDPEKGADTPGIDGLRSLSDAEKWQLATTIHFDMSPSPVRRTYTPKPGKNELRPLGIPTIRDRATQHLIRLALEPAAETLLAPEQFGFRPGRSAWDAANHIRLRLRQPLYVLDADVTKFFDRINHDAILRAIPGPPRLIKAVRRLLKAGIMEGVALTNSDTGTPQGGPMSPLLANLVLADLAAHIAREFPASRVINGKKIAYAPYICIYADDFVVTHARLDVLEQVRISLDQWLAQRGLELHPVKTAIRNTASINDGYRSIRFLSFAFRHHRIGKHQGGGKGPKWFLWTGPSPEALKREYAKCAAVIDATQHSRKRNGAISDKARKGLATPEEIMVNRLNQIIHGWCNYHRPFFAKEVFSKLDHMLFKKLWKWTLRKHPNRKRQWVITRYWNNAKPWRFTVTSAKTGKPIQLTSAAATPITRQFPVRPEKSWYDGDWAYWAKRSGRYPMLTDSSAQALKRQKGTCPHCKQPITSDNEVSLATLNRPKGPRKFVIHRHCADSLRTLSTEPVFAGKGMIAARCGDNPHVGLTEPTVSRRTVGSTNTPGAPSGASDLLLTGVDPSAPVGTFSPDTNP